MIVDKCVLCGRELNFFDVYTEKINGEEQKLCKECYEKRNISQVDNDYSNKPITMYSQDEAQDKSKRDSSIWIKIVKALTVIFIIISIIGGGIIGGIGSDFGVIIGALVGGVIGLVSVSIIRIFVDMAEDIHYIANNMKK